MKLKLLASLVFAVCLLSLTGTSQAVLINWTDWASAVTGASGNASGTISGGINVSYTGDITFAQTSGGTNWWTEGAPAPYTGNAVVDNAPSASDIIALSRAGITNTLSFSTPLVDPVMAFVSIGRSYMGVSYNFDAPFTLLSEGQGWWGDGWWQQTGNSLTGYEAHGVIQFNGTFSSISWDNSPTEYWHGITIGSTGAAPVPEPGTVLLLGSGLLGVVALRKKIKKS